jgi:hypothetical protein
LWDRRRLEQELAEEMAYHREQMPADVGRERRLREDQSGWAWLDHLSHHRRSHHCCRNATMGSTFMARRAGK